MVVMPEQREIHTIRDSWTELNVTPAKIMTMSILILVYQIQQFCSKDVDIVCVC